MKQKGFTLIELIGVLILLSILATIAVSTVAKSVNHSRENAYNDQIGIIVAGAKNWVADHISSIPNEGSQTKVLLGELVSGGYVEKDLKNPITEKKFSNETYVTIKNNLGEYLYEVTTIDE